MAVYKNYSAEELDRQYDNLAAVPEHQDLFEKFAKESAEYRETADCLIDESYGDMELEDFDIFFSEDKKAPLHIYIHGGYWQRQDKVNYSFAAKPLVEAGANVVMLNYPLCPEVTITDISESVRRAVVYFHQNADKYGYDRDEIHISGHSAGGHLAAMMMTTDWTVFSGDLPRDVIKSAVGISGVYDLLPIPHTPVNDLIRMDEQTAKRNSPQFLDPVCKCPMTVAVGGAETDEFQRQSEDFAEAWKEEGVDITFMRLPKLNHFTIMESFADPSSDLAKAVVKHMGL